MWYQPLLCGCTLPRAFMTQRMEGMDTLLTAGGCCPVGQCRIW